MICFAGPGAWSKEQQQLRCEACLRASTESEQGRQEEGQGVGVHGLRRVVVTWPMSQPSMSWLKELASSNTAAAQQ